MMVAAFEYSQEILEWRLRSSSHGGTMKDGLPVVTAFVILDMV